MLYSIMKKARIQILRISETQMELLSFFPCVVIIDQSTSCQYKWLRSLTRYQEPLCGRFKISHRTSQEKREPKFQKNIGFVRHYEYFTIPSLSLFLNHLFGFKAKSTKKTRPKWNHQSEPYVIKMNGFRVLWLSSPVTKQLWLVRFEHI